MTEERPFEEVKPKIDMKIYGADSEDAKWFKQWCDRQGITFAMGIKLMRISVEKDTMYLNILEMLKGHDVKISEIFEIMGELDNKINNAKDTKPKGIKTFGAVRE